MSGDCGGGVAQPKEALRCRPPSAHYRELRGPSPLLSSQPLFSLSPSL